MRTSRYVTETPAQRITVLSATPLPPAPDEARAPDSERTVVDGPRHLGPPDFKPPLRAYTDRGHRVPTRMPSPAPPPLEEAFDHSPFFQDAFIQTTNEHDPGFIPEEETTLSSVPDLLDNQETSRHHLAEEPPPFLPAAPAPPYREDTSGATTVVQPDLLSGVPTARSKDSPAPRSLALPPPPPKRSRGADAPGVARDPGKGDKRPPQQPREAGGASMVGGRYRIVERIGAGGMGKVFKVIHAKLGKTFALKIIRDNLAGQDKARDLFYREARLASSLSHPNITSVVDFGEDEKLGAFMVMEFLQGEALSRLLKREKRLGLRQALEIIQQIAEALHYIHSKGIIHCDIKTENILLTEVPDSKRRRLQVKLLDFGLARSTTATRNTNSLAGTPHYVAPERIRGREATPASDIYGLGILFYEMLTGRVPWDGSVDEILSGHLNLTPTPPSRLIEGGLDPAVEKLILRALAKTPEKRHKNIAAFLYELRTVMDMLGYGRRRGGARRVVVERPANQRDEAARALFDACRVPMALLDRAGMILVANPAFAQFIMGIAVDVEGMSVASTPLARVWATFSSDLARVCDGTSLRRTIEIELDPGEIRRLLLWLDPGLNDDQAIFGVHPLDG